MENLAVFLRNIDSHYVYAILMISCYVENIFPPFPGDSVVVIGAYLVGMGFLKFGFTFIFTCIGSILGFMTIYYAGVIFKNKIIHRKNNKSKFFNKISRIERWFNKYGYKLILFNRFLVGVRSAIALTAGVLNLEKKKVFYLGFISILLWNGILIYIGYIVGENWRIVLRYLRNYNISVLSLFILIGMVYFLVQLIKKRRINNL